MNQVNSAVLWFHAVMLNLIISEIARIQCNNCHVLNVPVGDNCNKYVGFQYIGPHNLILLAFTTLEKCKDSWSLGGNRWTHVQ